MKPRISQERIGEIFVMTEVMIFALFPILINYIAKIMPPILFGGISMILASTQKLPPQEAIKEILN